MLRNKNKIRSNIGKCISDDGTQIIFLSIKKVVETKKNKILGLSI